jgi:hypothetical protein
MMQAVAGSSTVMLGSGSSAQATHAEAKKEAANGLKWMKGKVGFPSAWKIY